MAAERSHSELCERRLLLGLHQLGHCGLHDVLALDHHHVHLGLEEIVTSIMIKKNWQLKVVAPSLELACLVMQLPKIINRNERLSGSDR